MAIRLEERYKGIRSPHKFKGGISGCVRECAEAQGKDFGLIATDKGWNSKLAFILSAMLLRDAHTLGLSVSLRVRERRRDPPARDSISGRCPTVDGRAHP